MKELSEDSKFAISIKSLVGIGATLTIIIGFYFTLKAEIEEAKQLPESEISRTEYELKDQLVRETIMNTQEDVAEIKNKQDQMDDKLDDIIKVIYQR